MEISINEGNLEKLSGVVERVTYHNEQNGWSVLKVSPFGERDRLVTVLAHQVEIFAGSSMDFWGCWAHHPKYGEQFKATRSLEKRPASTAALEKYLGSGMIHGVGPATAKRIVSYFKGRTLDVFESSIQELMSIPGIAEKKLKRIESSWAQHRAIRDVMIFLQGHGISTLFATKIYKVYGDRAIACVSENPYRLAGDIYGIGFFSADKIALSLGLLRNGLPRLEAGIKHVLSAARNDGHCFLTREQIVSRTLELLGHEIKKEQITSALKGLLSHDQVKVRRVDGRQREEDCFYSKGPYYDEEKTSRWVQKLIAKRPSHDLERIRSWVHRYCLKYQMNLAKEQETAVCGIPLEGFSILTGKPGCGKTTCTKVLVQLLKAMGLKVTLAAPTGRAAQRMTDVIGERAKTIHRLLEWAPKDNRFKFDENRPLATDFFDSR